MLNSRPSNDRPLRRWLVAVALALCAHALYAGFIATSGNGAKRDKPKLTAIKDPLQAVSMRNLSGEQWSHNRGVDNVRTRPPPEAKREEPPKGQVVAVAPGNGEQDANAKYIAETNNKVSKETRARDQTANYRNAMARKTSPKASEGTGQDPGALASMNGNNGTGLDARPPKEAQAASAMEIPDIRPRDKVAIDDRSPGPGISINNQDEREAVQGNSNRLALAPNPLAGSAEASAGTLGTPGVRNLMPSSAALDKILGAAPNDYLRDVEDADGTFLSTREWKFAGFFNRVKKTIGEHWAPGEVLRVRDPTGAVYGGRDRYTLVAVVLDSDGRLLSTAVQQSSGLDFLDQEAVRAFERSQPFPNPPPGLLATDQTIRFQFGFFMEMSGRPAFKLFRRAAN